MNLRAHINHVFHH